MTEQVNGVIRETKESDIKNNEVIQQNSVINQTETDDTQQPTNE